MDINEEEKAKASAWYAVSYFEKNNNTTPIEIQNKIINNEGYKTHFNRIEKFPQKFIGLPWFFVRSILLKIKSVKKEKKGMNVQFQGVL